MSAPAVTYARYSTDRQDARSIDDQLRRCREYAERHGFEVVAEYRDEATSGASVHRAGLQGLLASARRRPAPFKTVLVDDLSRLSRDLGDTWSIIFGDLRAAGVRLVGVADGVDSSARNARVDIGIRAVVNTAFLEMVSTETHRGLEGRALAGFHTGGACYGYITEPEPHPQDPERPRSVVKVDQQQAQIVRRIFELYAEGASLASIVDALNTENVRAPQDGSSKKRAGRGWSKNQLHFMLRNERYIGRIVWNKREWVKVNGRRRPRTRPESEWKIREEPALAIVDAATWTRVQERHRDNAKPRGRAGRKGYLDHILSGLLRCGSCGSPMSIVARKVKNGVSFSQYGCSARHAKGAAICSNRLTVSEKRINDSVLTALRDYFESADFEAYLEAAFRANQRQRELDARRDDVGAQLQAAVHAAESRVEKLTEAIARLGVSDALAAKLRAEEAKLLDARQRAAQLAAAPAPKALPASYTPAAILAVLRHLEAAAATKPQKAKALVRRFVESILMKPTPTGYAVTVSLKSINPQSHEAVGVDSTGCGGRI